jgi:L-ascorbate metabolism protein UlaG (beta-lactamase superfamily)
MKTESMLRRRFLGVSGCGAVGVFLGTSIGTHQAHAASAEAVALVGGFTWITQSGFRVQDRTKVVYFDPIGLTAASNDADLVCVSHSHGDHCEAASVRRILKDGTKVVTEPESAATLRSVANDITILKPGDEITVGEIKVKAVHSYNINKTNHPKSKNWLGFVVTLSDGRRVYHAGDTDNIPEMADIETDVALLPVGGTYTMDYREAAEAAKTIQPRVAVPMHYGSRVGTPQDGKRFEELLAGVVQVVVFEPGQTIPPSGNRVQDWHQQ